MQDVKPVALADIREAQKRLTGLAIRSPVVRCDAGPSGKAIHLKLENLQPIGSFKVRPIGNTVLALDPGDLTGGLCTASSGNSAIGVAWMASRLGVPATALVPAGSPVAKLDRLRSLGATVVELSFEDWWGAIETGGPPGQAGRYIDAVRDPASLAGDATIGVEILEQLPGVEAILVPFGGGGLACGIACAVRALNPRVKIIACELTTAHPLSAARRAGRPVSTPHEAGFISGVGYGSVLREMWPLARDTIDDVITVSLEEVAAAIRILAEHNKIIAEGAGAVSVAAALAAMTPDACAPWSPAGT